MKTVVTVIVKYDTLGKKTPLAIVWEDGRSFPVDYVTDVRPCASLKSGGAGIRYTCLVRGRPVYLFEETDHWFVERPAT